MTKSEASSTILELRQLLQRVNVDHTSTDSNNDNDSSVEKVAALKIYFPETEVVSEEPVLSYVHILRTSLASLTCSKFEKLSINDQKLVVKAIEFLCVLGISPYLQEGVGLPYLLQSRLAKSAVEVLKPVVSDSLKSVDNLERNLRTLSSIIWSDSCGFFTFNKFIHVYLAAVMQLVFSPICRKTLEISQSAYDRKFWCGELEKLVKNSFKPLFLKELFILQGAKSEENKEVLLGFDRTVITDSKTSRFKLKRAPLWLRNACGRVITDSLWTDCKTGVISLLETLFSDSEDWSKDANDSLDSRIGTVVDIILTIPKNKDRSDYLLIVTTQIWDIFSLVASSKVSPLQSDRLKNCYRIFAVMSIRKLFLKSRDIFDSKILPKFNDSVFLNFQSDQITPGQIVVSNDRINELLNWLDLITCGITVDILQNQDCMMKNFLFCSSFKVLFGLVIQSESKNQSNIIRARCRELMSQVFKSVRSEDFRTFLTEWTENTFNDGHHYWVEFVLGGDNSVSGIKQSKATLCIASQSKNLVSYSLDNLASKSIPWILELFQNLSEIGFSDPKSCSKYIFELSVIEEFFSNYSSKVLSDPDTFLSAANSIMGAILNHGTSNLTEFMYGTLQYLFSVLLMLTEARNSMSLKQQESLSEVVKKSEGLKISLELEKKASVNNVKIEECLQTVQAFLVGYKTGTGFDQSQTRNRDKQRSFKKTDAELAFENAYLLMKDPILPIRAAGMKQVSWLVKNNNTCALARLDEIITFVLGCLEDEDSYLYMSAVLSLANISLHLPSNQIDTLLNLYTSTETSLDEDCVVKLGESLTRFVVERGQLIVSKRNQFLNALLFNCRDEKSYFVRASSLSNLSQLVEKLRYSIHLDIHEVTNMAINSVNTTFLWPNLQLEDHSNQQSSSDYEAHFEENFSSNDEVGDGRRDLNECRAKLMFKRSSVMLLRSLTSLILNDDETASSIFDGRVLKDLYSVLTRVYHRDDDLTCRLHAQLALEVINFAMKKIWTDMSMPKIQTDLKVIGLPPM